MFIEQKFNLFLTQLGFLPPPHQKKLNLRCELSPTVYTILRYLVFVIVFKT